MAMPNLFKFATSELSQDAFICWLLSWAKKEYQTGDDKQKALNAVANRVLVLFFDKADKNLPSSIDTIVVQRQISNIDILCIINDTYCVLIEDKVGSIQHSDQLVRYKQFMIDGHSQVFEEDKIVAIYLQTHDQSNYKKVIKDGFYPVVRKDLLDIFENQHVEASKYSDIYTNFYDYLQSIENAVQSFKHLPVSKWGHRAWIGFFQYLQSQLGEGNWGYVANPAGGFMGFWGLTRRVGDMDIYLQLEQDKICFKMAIPEKENRSNLRNRFYKLFATEAANFDLTVSKPKRFGLGKHMTFAVLDTDIINTNNKNLVNLEDVNILIDELRRFINHGVDQYEKQRNIQKK